jgi:dynamin-binding protein
VIEPFELVIKAYGNPSLAMKKRAKRRLDYERSEQLKKGGKHVDSKLREQVEQYEALNDTLKKELPKLSGLTEKVGNICLGNFVNIQANWFGIWQEKVKVVLGPAAQVPELKEIMSAFQQDFKFAQEGLTTVGILNPAYKGRTSQSTTTSTDEYSLTKIRTRPTVSDLSPRDRGHSVNSDQAPVLPTPDFNKRHSGQFTLSPTGTVPSPHQYYYRDYYAGINNQQQRPGSGSPNTPDTSGGFRPAAPPARPSTGRSYDSSAAPRQSPESAAQNRRDSNSMYGYPTTGTEPRRFSGIFHSALPLPDGVEEGQRSSRASSRERIPAASCYNILWLAASLFEFNIETTKHEAGYPYLIYQAGEVSGVLCSVDRIVLTLWY